MASKKKKTVPRKTKKKASKKKTVRKKRAKKKSGKVATKKSTGKAGAPPGNQFWKARSSHGRKPIFEKPEQLLEACCEYFQWVEENPLFESKLTTYKGKSKLEQIPKMRAMTLAGLCIFLDIARQTWDNYKEIDDFLEVTGWVDDVIQDQKFSGAAADLLNANIIARDLGLKDKSELSTKDGNPLVQVYLPDNGRD